MGQINYFIVHFCSLQLRLEFGFLLLLLHSFVVQTHLRWHLEVACCIDEQFFVSSKYHSLIQEDKGIELVVQCESFSSEVLQLQLRYLSLSIIPQRNQCSIYPCVCRLPWSTQHVQLLFPYAFGCFSYCVFLKENAGTLCSIYSGLRPYNVWYIVAASFLLCHHHQIVFLVL